jgi:hypothetical protein
MSRLNVPRDLWNKAESLSEIGVEELAWRPEDAAQMLELLRPTEIAVLGGDVYVKRAGQFEPSYENWYAARGPSGNARCVRNPQSLHRPRLYREPDEFGGRRTVGHAGPVGTDVTCGGGRLTPLE